MLSCGFICCAAPPPAARGSTPAAAAAAACPSAPSRPSGAAAGAAAAGADVYGRRPPRQQTSHASERRRCEATCGGPMGWTSTTRSRAARSTQSHGADRAHAGRGARAANATPRVRCVSLCRCWPDSLWRDDAPKNIALGYLGSYDAAMGLARLECVGGCACRPTLLEGRHATRCRTSVTFIMQARSPCVSAEPRQGRLKQAYDVKTSRGAGRARLPFGTNRGARRKRR